MQDFFCPIRKHLKSRWYLTNGFFSIEGMLIEPVRPGWLPICRYCYKQKYCTNL
jgi:hypothetical protein